MRHLKTQINLTTAQQLRLLVYAAGLLILMGPLRARLEASTKDLSEREAIGKLQRVINDLRARLEIAEPVVVSLVPQNALAFSVEPPKQRGGAFVLSVESAYLEMLTEDELEAALAHELGHVWIYTHHPYLHTEQLANRIAMRATPRDSLARLYDKLWKRLGAKGDLTEFLGS